MMKKAMSKAGGKESVSVWCVGGCVWGWCGGGVLQEISTIDVHFAVVFVSLIDT